MRQQSKGTSSPRLWLEPGERVGQHGRMQERGGKMRKRLKTLLAHDSQIFSGTVRAVHQTLHAGRSLGGGREG